MNTTTVPTAAAGGIFTQVKRRRVFEEICDQIRGKLARGDYRPGDKLPTERELAAELGVGRPAVREALRTLENAGILMLKKGLRGGAFVREGDPETVTQSLQDLISLGHMTLAELTEARRMITSDVLRLACERGTEDEFEAIERSIERCERFDAPEHYREKLTAGGDFFRLMAVAAHNKVLKLLNDSLTMIVWQAAMDVKPAANPRTDPTRRVILRCLRERDVRGGEKALELFFDDVEGEFQRALGRRGNAG